MASSEGTNIKDLKSSPPAASKQRSPYKRPGSLKVKCVARRELAKAMEFSFSSDTISIAKSKKSVHYGVADASDAIKVTADENVLTRIGADMEEGKSYILRDYGLVPGRHPGGTLLFLKPSTMMFRTSTVEISGEVAGRAREAIHPPSPQVPASEAATATNRVMTLQGQVISNTAPRRVETKDGPVPVRDVELSCDGDPNIKITLWREVALEPVVVGTYVKVTHLRCTEDRVYGVKWHSTQYTKVQLATTVPRQLSVMLTGLAVKEEKVVWGTESCGDLFSSNAMIEHLVPGVQFDELCELLPLQVHLVVEGQEVKEVVKS